MPSSWARRSKRIQRVSAPAGAGLRQQLTLEQCQLTSASSLWCSRTDLDQPTSGVREVISATSLVTATNTAHEHHPVVHCPVHKGNSLISCVQDLWQPKVAHQLQQGEQDTVSRIRVDLHVDNLLEPGALKTPTSVENRGSGKPETDFRIRVHPLVETKPANAVESWLRKAKNGLGSKSFFTSHTRCTLERRKNSKIGNIETRMCFSQSVNMHVRRFRRVNGTSSQLHRFSNRCGMRVALASQSSDLAKGQSARSLAHSMFGASRRKSVLVHLCKLRSTWNEVGLHLRWKW